MEATENISSTGYSNTMNSVIEQYFLRDKERRKNEALSNGGPSDS